MLRFAVTFISTYALASAIYAADLSSEECGFRNAETHGYVDVTDNTIRKVNGQMKDLAARIWEGVQKPEQFYPCAYSLLQSVYGGNFELKLKDFLNDRAKQYRAPKTNRRMDIQISDPHASASFFSRMPKGGDLHNHLTGAVDPETLFKIARELEVKLPKSTIESRLRAIHADPSTYHLEAYSDPVLVSVLSNDLRAALESSIAINSWDHTFADFAKKWDLIKPLTQSPKAEVRLVEHLALKAHDENVFYLELIPSTTSDAMTAISENLARVESETGTRVRFLARDSWGQTQEHVRAVVNTAKDLNSKYDTPFVGFNMVGDELKGSLQYFEVIRAVKSGTNPMHIALHAGEQAGSAKDIVAAFLLGSERIGHGTYIEQDPVALFLVYANRIPVEVNLTSNELLVMQNLKVHPLPKLIKWGVPVILGTDDAGVFNTTLSAEFEKAARIFGFHWGEMKKLARAGIEYAFLSQGEKNELLHRFDQAMNQFEASIR